jgi:tetratricopeptide (TPR) repeat protein
MHKTSLFIIYLIFISCALFARGADEKIEKGNKAYASGDYEQALKWYEEAEVRNPESPYIYFNKGTVYFRLEDYEKAKEAFLAAATRTKDLSFEAKTYYNLGNTIFFEAGRHTESDLQKAIDLYQEAVTNYQLALDRIKNNKNTASEIEKSASHNIEVARLIVRDLLDKLKKQQEQNQGQDDKLKEIMKKIAELIEREQRTIDHTNTLKEDLDKKGITSALKNNAGKVKTEQQGIRKETKNVSEELGDLIRQGQGAGAQTQNPQAEKITKAKEHVDLSGNYQQLTENQLDKITLAGAASSETSARDELIEALKSLSGESQQQNQDNQQKEEDKQQEEQMKKQAADAKDIIDEERENKKEREQQARSGYSPVTRDW